MPSEKRGDDVNMKDPLLRCKDDRGRLDDESNRSGKDAADVDDSCRIIMLYL